MSRFLTRLQHLWQQSGIPAHPQQAAVVAAALLLAAALVYLVLRARRPTAVEMERRRRAFLAKEGRITDGSIVDARTFEGEESLSPTPELLLYRYRIAGVTYDCGQDVSVLASQTAGYRIDQPIQVKYDPRNPGNSIIVSEDWNGLRVKQQRPLPFGDDTPAVMR